MANNNKNLHKAKAEKNDEFYTQLSDIEKELMHYKPQFKDKVVYCNCDDPTWSNFFKYFQLNFHHLGLKKLISTHFEADGKASYKLEITSDNINGQTTIPTYTQTPLKGNGDFRSEECIALLKEADIVVTNPPFSLFREYIAILIEHGKQFACIGSMNAITYKEIFPLIKEGKLGLGNNTVKEFVKPNGEIQKFGNINWYTNIPHTKTKTSTMPPLYKTYNEAEYPKYDNYDAIEVGHVDEIPVDYDGVMGVPISYLFKHDPMQFEIIDANDCRRSEAVKFKECMLVKDKESAINGKPKYVRILIKRKN